MEVLKVNIAIATIANVNMAMDHLVMVTVISALYQKKNNHIWLYEIRKQKWNKVIDLN